MTTPQEPCRTCDGTGYVETAPPDSRVIHHEPCPDCAAQGEPAAADPLVQVLIEEYAAVLTHSGAWWRNEHHAAPRALQVAAYDQGALRALRRVAGMLGVSDLHARAAEALARGERQERP